MRKLFSEERKIPLFKKKTLLYVQLRPEAQMRSVSPTTFSGRSPKASGSIFNSIRQRLSLKSTITHAICCAVFATIGVQDVLYLQLRVPSRPLSVKPHVK